MAKGKKNTRAKPTNISDPPTKQSGSATATLAKGKKRGPTTINLSDINAEIDTTEDKGAN